MSAKVFWQPRELKALLDLIADLESIPMPEDLNKCEIEIVIKQVHSDQPAAKITNMPDGEVYVDFG